MPSEPDYEAPSVENAHGDPPTKARAVVTSIAFVLAIVVSSSVTFFVTYAVGTIIGIDVSRSAAKKRHPVLVSGYSTSARRPTVTRNSASAARHNGSRIQTETPNPIGSVPNTIETVPTTIAYGNCVRT